MGRSGEDGMGARRRGGHRRPSRAKWLQITLMKSCQSRRSHRRRTRGAERPSGEPAAAAVAASAAGRSHRE